MDDNSFLLLKLYLERESLSASDLALLSNGNSRDYLEPILYLVDRMYLEVMPLYNDNHPKKLNIKYRITPDGRRALEAEEKERRRYKHNEIRAWITLAIAIAAFILSVVSMILQI